MKDHPGIFCPKCNKTLELETIEDKKYLTCKGKPQCDFKLEWVDSKQNITKRVNYPKCPNCKSELTKRRN